MNTVSCVGTYPWFERDLDAREPITPREAVLDELPLGFKAISSCPEETLADAIELLRDCGEALREGGDASACALSDRKRYETSDQAREMLPPHSLCLLNEQGIATVVGKAFHTLQ